MIRILGIAVLSLVTGAGLIAWAIFLSVLRDEWKTRRARLQLAKAKEDRRARIAALPKGKIIVVGFVKEIAPGAFHVDDWQVLYPGNPHAILDGMPLWCGYSVDELKEIMARKAEFEP